jgi:hypothetical protein
MLQILLVILVTLAAVVVILLLNVLVPQQTTSSINTSSYTYDDVVNANNLTITQSWCLNQNPSTIYSDSQLKSLCGDFYNKYFANIGISMVISLAVVIISLALVLLVKSLVRFQRYKCYNQEVSSSINSILFANILTTTVITLLVIRF